MTADESVAARAWRLLAAATPGPWWTEPGFNGPNEYVYGMRRGGRPNGEGIATASYYGRKHADSHADAEFIAAAPELVRSLLTERNEAVELLRRVPSLTIGSHRDWRDAVDVYLARLAVVEPTNTEGPRLGEQEGTNP